MYKIGCTLYESQTHCIIFPEIAINYQELTFSCVAQSASPFSHSIPWFSHAGSAPGDPSQCWTPRPPVGTRQKLLVTVNKSLQQVNKYNGKVTRQTDMLQFTLAKISSTFSLASCSMKAIMCFICSRDRENTVTCLSLQLSLDDVLLNMSTNKFTIQNIHFLTYTDLYFRFKWTLM